MSLVGRNFTLAPLLYLTRVFMRLYILMSHDVNDNKPLTNYELTTWRHRTRAEFTAYKIVMNIDNCNLGVPTVSGKTKGL